MQFPWENKHIVRDIKINQIVIIIQCKQSIVFQFHILAFNMPPTLKKMRGACCFQLVLLSVWEWEIERERDGEGKVKEESVRIKKRMRKRVRAGDSDCVR